MLNLNPTLDQPEQKNYNLQFNGSGAEFFKIWILNTILTIFTLGFYYPWARASKLNYLYENTEFNGSPFTFHGTGIEMFKGFIKIFSIYIVVIGFFYYAVFTTNAALIGISYLILLLFTFGIVPLAIHGSMRYRASKSSWRGIFFEYRGSLGEMYKKFIIGTLLTLITFGIYSFWFRVEIRKYIFDNLYFGDAKFQYHGDGGDLFKIQIKLMLFFGFIYTIIFGIFGVSLTASILSSNGPSSSLLPMIIGVYIIAILITTFFVYARMLILNGYHLTNTRILHNDNSASFHYNYKTMVNISAIVKDALLTIVTIGFAFPWAFCNLLKHFMDNLHMEGDIDFDDIKQSSNSYSDATGEDLSSWLDIDLS
jgi:uncharacterized membrane protein YjgN (DUF898 family)